MNIEKNIALLVLLVTLGTATFAQKKATIGQVGRHISQVKRSASQAKRSASLVKLKKYVAYFNALDSEAVKNFVPNDQAFQWLADNVPLLECPDPVIEKIYYYRWWSYRKHLVKTPEGFIFTEFIEPVKHAGKYNSISCALGHHIYEGRWLKNTNYLQDYIDFWLYHADEGQTKQRFHQFSSWIDDAVYQNYLVNPDLAFLKRIMPALDKDYSKWEEQRQLPTGLFWQFDVKDGMEESISGSRKAQNRRPSINSYMYGNALALQKMALLVKNDTLQGKYQLKAGKLKKLVQDSLWNQTANFFETSTPKGNSSNVREAIGFIPWDFNLPDDQAVYAKAWDQILDTTGFKSVWGLTTAERRDSTFRTRGTGHSCEWDGALWPFASSQTLKGLSNLLTNYKNHGKMNNQVFYNELHKYALSHQKKGKPYLGEYQDEKNGEWLKGDNPRSSFYNHSSFCDLIINDLIGVKPRVDQAVEIYPLIPKGQWDWFLLDNVSYHGKILTVLWDKTGKKYHKGKGMSVYADGKLILNTPQLKRALVSLN